MAKVWIDAGHGGGDSGAVGGRSFEKNNVLKVALKLGSYLIKLGHQIGYSRKTDKYLTLSERAKLANSWGADVFISLHNNSATSKIATGFETFIYNGNVNNRTRELQDCVHSEIAKGIGIRDRGKKRANFAVLRETKMDSILIEYAFISNSKDENILVNEVNKLSLLTANGVAKFYGNKPLNSSINQTKPNQDEVKKLQEIKKLEQRIIALENKLKKTEKKKKELKTSTSPSKYAIENVKWAKKRGITDGSRIRDVAAREEVLAYLHRVLTLKDWQRDEILKYIDNFDDVIEVEKWKERFEKNDVTADEVAVLSLIMKLRERKK